MFSTTPTIVTGRGPSLLSSADAAQAGRFADGLTVHDNLLHVTWLADVAGHWSLLGPNESRFCWGAPLDCNTDSQNLTAPSAASAG